MKESYVVERMNDVYYKVYYVRSEEGKKEVKASYTYFILISQSIGNGIFENKRVVEMKKEVNIKDIDIETEIERKLTLDEYIKVLESIREYNKLRE